MKNLFLMLSLAVCFLSRAKIPGDSLHFPMPVKTAVSDDCDACGCAAGNGSSGFESLLNPQFIGVKYFAQHYKAKENLFVNELTQDQYFNTLQLWAKVPVTEKLGIYAGLPFHFHEKRTLQGNIRISGPGDASLMGIYRLLKSGDNIHQLNGGAGIKFPLGKFDEKGLSGVNPGFQLGTGSWDYLMVLNYKFRKNRTAVLLNTDYTVKTGNRKHYRFGNQWNYSATGFYQVSGNGNIIFSGKTGIQGEVYDRNRQFGEILPDTSGSALYGKFGFEAACKGVSLGSEIMLPVYSDLAGGSLEAKSRFSLFLNVGI